MRKSSRQSGQSRQSSLFIPVAQWKLWWTRIIRSAELALIVAFLSLAFEFGEDSLYLSASIACAWLVAAASVATYQSLDQAVTALGVTAFTPNRIRLLASVAFALIFGFAAIAIHHHAEAKIALASTPSKPVPPALFEAQLRELAVIEELIGRKDEHHLREEFQLSDIFDHNVMQVVGLVSPDRETAEQRTEVDRFFAGGNTQVDLRFVRTAASPNGGVMIFPVTGRIGTINLSKQYVYGKALLRYFESSATIPASVRDSIRQFDATLDKDARLMFDVLNDKYAEDPNNLYRNFDRSTDYFHTIHNAYLHRLIPLKPASDKVVASIRAYLKTD